MKGFNNIYFRQHVDFFAEFIPQIVLLLSLFGWMDLLIIGKWLTPKNINENWDPNSDEYKAIALSPSIITTMIDMFLNAGDNTNPDGSLKY